jgi:hypothetical protein
MARAKKPKVVDDKDFGATHGGTAITEELAEQWATEIESEDFDLTHWERCDDGLPLLAQSDTEPGVAFPLSSSELSSLRLRAREGGGSLSDLIREALAS